ncbi:hypothetical protein DAEQUDRAFT_299431 [Daedalea quercina L-15889]|uniref:Uncharacterized protein n=1 Tax=Daedalea quercina L-15889 TaxID=1314783 RepID=A0A165Q5C9_9APHY|nr:hypothetical protein DAEQUDRAFT_299431 [Daedalea quercina L-15889]
MEKRSVEPVLSVLTSVLGTNPRGCVPERLKYVLLVQYAIGPDGNCNAPRRLSVAVRPYTDPVVAMQTNRKSRRGAQIVDAGTRRVVRRFDGGGCLIILCCQSPERLLVHLPAIEVGARASHPSQARSANGPLNHGRVTKWHQRRQKNAKFRAIHVGHDCSATAAAITIAFTSIGTTSRCPRDARGIAGDRCGVKLMICS